MFELSYILFFYILGFLGILLLLLVLLALGVFNQGESKKAKPLTTLDFLISQVKNSNDDTEVLDAVMKEFYANHYNISKNNKEFDKWLKLIQEIAYLNYMSVEQVANFRDDLAAKNPAIKKDIEYSVGVSLKHREENSKKK